MRHGSLFEPRAHLRILFSFRSLWYLKFYDAVFRALVQRGHRIHVLVDHGENNPKVAAWTAPMLALTKEFDAITFQWTPRRLGDRWVDLSYITRRSLDYLRFLEPQFDEALVLRRRAADRAPQVLRTATSKRPLSHPLVIRTLEHALARVERATAADEDIQQLLRQHAPDLVVVTPLVTLGSRQFDILRAAKRAGLPTALGVASWDHLSSKALIRVVPDRIFLWNRIQADEATRFHQLPPERLVITGAQCFDQWFEQKPSRSRADLCRQVGFSDDRPFILYVCSALFEGSPSEAALVSTWVARVRAASDPALRNASILIRPHPKRGHEWRGIDLRHHENVAIWPPAGEAPLDASTKASYFDSLYHCAAVVGLNTSAQLEGGIIGRPIYTILLPEFADNQEGTLHFRYLLEVEGGLLHAARTFDEHLQQLAEGLRDPEAAARRNRRFVETFVRPHGLERRATDVFVDALERLPDLTQQEQESGQTVGSAALRVLLYPLARMVRGTAQGTRALWREERRRRRLEQRARGSWWRRGDRELPLWMWSFRFAIRPLGSLLPFHAIGRDMPWRRLKQRALADRRARGVDREQRRKLAERERRWQDYRVARANERSVRRRKGPAADDAIAPTQSADIHR